MRTYTRLLKEVRPYWLAFVVSIIGNILYAAVDAGFIKFLEPLLNQGFVGRDPTFIRMIPFVVVAIFLIRSVAGISATYFMGWVGRKVVMNLRVKLFDKLLTLPASFYHRYNSGELISKITYNVEQVADASTDALTVLVRESSTAIALLAVMISISWQITLIFLFVIPVMATLMHFVSLRCRRLSTNIQNSMGGLTHVSGEAIDGHLVVKMYGGEKYETKRFCTAANENRSQEMKLITTSAVGVSMVQLTGGFALALTIYLATSRHAVLTPGGFTAMMAAMIALLKPIKQLTKINTKIQRGLAAALSIFTMLDEAEEIDAGKVAIEQAKGKLELTNVNFSYPDTTSAAIQNIDLTIPAGTTLALVGHSGSGKSTLVNLLARIYEADGSIKLDGTEIKEIKLADLRRQIAMVTQQVVLFNDTISNNIAYGMLEQVTDAEIEAAAKLAHAWEFIQVLPEGLNTMVGENGVRLSGGQRQRLALARAILKDAPILILDEATSALDTESERYIQQALEELKQQRTAIVIAHRLSTIENADLIAVMQHGEITELGTHTELLAKQGYYARLLQMQFGYEDIKNEQTKIMV